MILIETLSPTRAFFRDDHIWYDNNNDISLFKSYISTNIDGNFIIKCMNLEEAKTKYPLHIISRNLFLFDIEKYKSGKDSIFTHYSFPNLYFLLVNEKLVGIYNNEKQINKVIDKLNTKKKHSIFHGK